MVYGEDVLLAAEASSQRKHAQIVQDRAHAQSAYGCDRPQLSVMLAVLAATLGAKDYTKLPLHHHTVCPSKERMSSDFS
jgi:hypothetical protein